MRNAEEQSILLLSQPQGLYESDVLSEGDFKHAPANTSLPRNGRAPAVEEGRLRRRLATVGPKLPCG